MFWVRQSTITWLNLVSLVYRSQNPCHTVVRVRAAGLLVIGVVAVMLLLLAHAPPSKSPRHGLCDDSRSGW